MDLTKLSDADLLALKAGDYSKMSDDGLRALKASDKPEPSGAAAGAMHGAAELINGPAETLKRFAGVGPGRQDDPNYVGTDFLGGSANPLKWNWGQAPQIIAENAPGLAAGAGAAAAGAKTAKKVGLGKKAQMLSALVAAGLYGWGSSAGDTAKEATVARTGDTNAESSTADLVKGGITAAAANTIGALAPTRFVPGMKQLNKVGAEGVSAAIQRAMGTTAIGAGAGAASDLVTQAGTKMGTDQSIDYNRVGNAGAAGGLTAGSMASFPLAGDSIRATNNREFGGANTQATENYSTRLATHGEGVGGLGNAKRDAAAQRLVKGDLTNELRDAVDNVKKTPGARLSPDADNALTRAVKDETITPKDLELIERETAGTPDGANASYLARTLRVAQLAQGKGTFSEKGWAGGVSGVMDNQLGFLLNPLRMIGGAGASALGMHVLGMGNPKFAAGVAGAYLGARGLDGMTGMRSPAKSFAENFANQNAQLRMPPTQQGPAAGPTPPPGPAPSGPWNPAAPAPAYGPTGTVTGTRPAQPAPGGPWGPKPLQTTSGVPNVPHPGMPQAPQPGTMPWQKPQISELWKGPNPIALKMMAENMKRGIPPAPQPEAPKLPWAAPRVREEWKPPTVSNPAMPPLASLVKPQSTEVPKDVLANTKKIMAARAKVDAMKAAALAPTGEPASLGAAATPTGPQSMADILSNVNAQAKPKTIKKTKGKVEEAAVDDSGPFMPKHEEDLYPKGISPEAYAEAEANGYLGPNVPKARRDNYIAEAKATEHDRAETVKALQEAFPDHAKALEGMHRQMQKAGGSQKKILRIRNHYAGLLSPAAGKAVKEAF